MSRLKEMKKKYDEIPIPGELSIRIQKEIEQSRAKQAKEARIFPMTQFQKRLRAAAAAAAVFCILFTATLNTSAAFAAEAARLPLIGPLARVLTFRSYETNQDGIGISVEIPAIERIAEDTGSDETKINQEIYDMCSQYAEDAKSRAEEYRTAFLATGGTEEEWAAHNIKIQVGYEIKAQTSGYLSFSVSGTESWTSAYQEVRYYNLDIQTGKPVSLEELLGPDYISLADESIRAQIKERQKAGEIFWDEDEGGFSGISEDAKFYINENGRPVIVFDKYEIAPGSSGEIEFEIGG